MPENALPGVLVAVGWRWVCRAFSGMLVVFFLGGFLGLFGGYSPVLRSPLKQPPKPPKSPRNGRAWGVCGVGGVGEGEQENKENIFIFFLYLSRLSAVFCCSLGAREQGENRENKPPPPCPLFSPVLSLFSPFKRTIKLRASGKGTEPALHLGNLPGFNKVAHHIVKLTAGHLQQLG